MKVWLLLAAVVLLFASHREGFNPAMTRPSPADESILKAVSSYTGLDATKDNAKVLKYVTELQSFYDSVYLPDKKTPDQEQVKMYTANITDPDIDKTHLASLINYVFLTTEQDTKKEEKASAIPGGEPGSMTGTDTGGSSVMLGPTSGGTRGRNIWGPEFPGYAQLAAGLGGKAGDTTAIKNYPQLIGPKPDASTMIDGLGVVPPSKNWTLTQSGDLPTSESLGSDEKARYLPYSRTPGDQDLIPDPYRVATQFTTSTYSSKTEPVPFLTDFSAFQK
jgi:hypothetical protein